MKSTALKLAFVLVLAFTALGGGLVSVPSAEAHSHCPPAICPDVYSPVYCRNGQVYLNVCYAARDCQKDCIPWD